MQLPLKEIIEHLINEFGGIYATYHQYISSMESIEKTRLTDTDRVAFRLRTSGQHFPFPTADEIKTYTLREKVLRTFRFFDVENIDLALFMLSKEFEAALKGYFLAAMSAGELEQIEEKKLSLDTMINQMGKADIITDKATLSYLRQTRNDRAHGTMPSIKEREVLMKSAHYLAGLYIDYIKLFDDRRIELDLNRRE